jgi:ABC-type multidrug transport system fused ATPase/permease subunit
LVERLPKGLDSPLGELGLKLSGGERQRLSIARTLLKDAPLLVLDEPTANLDPITERGLLDATYELMHGRATLVITHRLVRMEDMDEILVLGRGRIVERGTHGELLAARGLYHQLLEVQRGVLATP